ncbi:MAG: hypothetical protein GC181_12330 [Bacteroidetes bacterium]|nr:hypothetical protein [Bacteroidota bacterium]
MKKNVLFVFGLVSLIVFISSCSGKDEIGIKDEMKDPQTHLTPTVNGSSYSLASVTCYGEGSGCYVFDTIVINPGKMIAIDDAISEGRSAIGTLFSLPEYGSMIADIDPEDAEHLQSGLYNMKKFFEDNVRVCYYVGSNENLNELNAEFSLSYLK